jgi:hypothetical protein
MKPKFQFEVKVDVKIDFAAIVRAFAPIVAMLVLLIA